MVEDCIEKCNFNGFYAQGTYKLILSNIFFKDFVWEVATWVL
jgi:hypothetical protein